jgi:hypothetical protein
MTDYFDATMGPICPPIVTKTGWHQEWQRDPPRKAERPVADDENRQAG